MTELSKNEAPVATPLVVSTPLMKRIDEAIRRITNGDAPMRIPADPSDPDLVLAECWRELTTLSARLAEVERALADTNDTRKRGVEMAMEIRRLEKDLFPEDSTLRERAESTESRIASLSSSLQRIRDLPDVEVEAARQIARAALPKE